MLASLLFRTAVSSMLHDVPSGGHGRQGLAPNGDSVFHQPDGTRPACIILPNEVGISVTVEISGPPNMPWSGNSGQHGHAATDNPIFDEPDDVCIVGAIFQN